MSRLADLRDRANRCEQPLSAFLELTYSCNWRCVFCFNSRHHDLAPLSVDEWRDVLVGLRSLGTLHVTLTGGEPLTHPAFFAIAEAARSLFFALRIFTNGALIDADTAARISGLHPAGVELSLHGAIAPTHDRVTGRAGSFDTLLRAVRGLQSRDVPLLLKTPLTRHNELEIEGMVGLARRLGVPYQIDPRLTPKDNGDPSPLALSASPEGAESVTGILGADGPVPSDRKRRLGEPHCALGRSTLAVDPEGNVYPCIQWRQTTLGNVRDASIAELWRSAPSRKEAAKVAVRANDQVVTLGSSIGTGTFCPALAFQVSGDPIGRPGLLNRESPGDRAP